MRRSCTKVPNESGGVVGGSTRSSYIMHADATLQDPMGLSGIITWFEPDRRRMAGRVRECCAKSAAMNQKSWWRRESQWGWKEMQPDPTISPSNSTPMLPSSLSHLHYDLCTNMPCERAWGGLYLLSPTSRFYCVFSISGMSKFKKNPKLYIVPEM
jgi:hypothetical protein